MLEWGMWLHIPFLFGPSESIEYQLKYSLILITV